MLEFETETSHQPTTVDIQVPTHEQLISQAVSDRLTSQSPIDKKCVHHLAMAKNYCQRAGVNNPTDDVLRAYATIRSELSPHPPGREDERYVQGMSDQNLLALIMHVGGYQSEYNMFTKNYPVIFNTDTLQRISTIPQMPKDPQYPL